MTFDRVLSNADVAVKTWRISAVEDDLSSYSFAVEDPATAVVAHDRAVSKDEVACFDEAEFRSLRNFGLKN